MLGPRNAFDFSQGDTAVQCQHSVRKEPRPIYDHDVPVLVASVGFDVKKDADWDPTTRLMLPFVNGYNHVAKIAADSNVDISLAKTRIQNLVSYGVVTLIPILKFSNTYRATQSFSRLFSDRELQEACLTFITKGLDSNVKPCLSDVFEILCYLRQGNSLRAVYDRYAESGGPGFDIRRLVIFAQSQDLIRCLKKYPIYVTNPATTNGIANRMDSMTRIRKLFTGTNCADEICCIAHIDLPTLEKIIEDDPNVSIIWR